MLRIKILGLSLITAKAHYKNTSDENINVERNAICILYPDNNSGVSGLVSFT